MTDSTEKAARLTTWDRKMGGQVCIDGYRFQIWILWTYLLRDDGVAALRLDYPDHDYLTDDVIAVAAALLRDAQEFFARRPPFVHELPDGSVERHLDIEAALQGAHQRASARGLVRLAQAIGDALDYLAEENAE